MKRRVAKSAVVIKAPDNEVMMRPISNVPHPEREISFAKGSNKIENNGCKCALRSRSALGSIFSSTREVAEPNQMFCSNTVISGVYEDRNKEKTRLVKPNKITQRLSVRCSFFMAARRSIEWQ